MFDYQCNRKVCKNADNPSIRTKTVTVNTAQAAKAPYKNNGAKGPRR